MSNNFNYPTPTRIETGCKVSWYFYDNEADAIKASEIAKSHAIHKLNQGYDFGYQSPGDVRHIEEDNLYVVVLP